MKYKEILALIKEKNYKRILITGPHRSGTTFAGTALAHDLHQPFFPEENIRGGSVRLYNRFYDSHQEFVLQAPGLSSNLLNIKEPDLIIFMDRPVKDILDSMDILNDRIINFEMNRIERMFGKKYVEGLSLPEAKRKVFEEYQKPKLKNTVYLEYNSMNRHKLWVSKVKRKGWHIRQTRIQ